MKRLFLLVVLYLFFNTNEANAQAYFKEEFPKVWKRAAHYTIAVAETMPESFYDSKVSVDGMSFKEQQLHIVTNISFLGRLISEEKTAFYDKEDINTLSKEEVIGILKIAFNYVGELMENIEPGETFKKIKFNNEEISKENIFYLIRDHMTHHRGQSIIYLRNQGVNVPKYIGW
ncbi:DinB family protein [Salegentibacter sp. JZCK2]|uniref:DinB family protein n=1 Tax=Salegentibacter tibetensis TaxID=2873600 RepID=UPI001CCDF391|nr:DinB family protein [Salegentibacter tibetensis]MBZ9731686.1 DinB family protein [Salegentibacter tibetensis]